jgi:hypothetical protein
VRAVEKWNRLPDRVRIEEKPYSFKRHLKKAMPLSMESGQTTTNKKALRN